MKMKRNWLVATSMLSRAHCTFPSRKHFEVRSRRRERNKTEKITVGRSY